MTAIISQGSLSGEKQTLEEILQILRCGSGSWTPATGNRWEELQSIHTLELSPHFQPERGVRRKQSESKGCFMKTNFF